MPAPPTEVDFSGLPVAHRPQLQIFRLPRIETRRSVTTTPRRVLPRNHRAPPNAGTAPFAGVAERHFSNARFRGIARSFWVTPGSRGDTGFTQSRWPATIRRPAPECRSVTEAGSGADTPACRSRSTMSSASSARTL